jgi:hypothetical protein
MEKGPPSGAGFVAVLGDEGDFSFDGVLDLQKSAANHSSQKHWFKLAKLAPCSSLPQV